MHYKEASTDPKWLPPLRSAGHPNPTQSMPDSWQTDPNGIVVFDKVPDLSELKEQAFGAVDADGDDGVRGDPELHNLIDDDAQAQSATALQEGQGKGNERGAGKQKAQGQGRASGKQIKAQGKSQASGAPSAHRTADSPVDPFCKDSILASVKQVATTFNAQAHRVVIEDSEIAEWDEWYRNTPSSLEDVPLSSRASAEMPTPYEPDPEPITSGRGQQVEILSFANPKGGRVEARKLRAGHSQAARRIKVAVGDNVIIRREKPPTKIRCSTVRAGWNTPFYLGKVVSVGGDAHTMEASQGVQVQWYCPYWGTEHTDNINNKWVLMTLAGTPKRRYVDTIALETIGAIVHLNKTKFLSAQAVKDIVELQHSLCPAGSPELSAIPPTGPNQNWIFGLHWGVLNGDDP